MFKKLGAVVYRRRRWVVAAWFVIAVVGMVAQGPLAERVTAEFTGSERIESARVLERLNDTAPTGGDIAIVIDGIAVADSTAGIAVADNTAGTTGANSTDGIAVADPAGPPAAVAEALADLAAVDGVISVIDPWSAGPVGPQLTATDGRAALVVVSYVNGLDVEAEHELTDAVVELANELEGAETEAGIITEVLVGGEPIVLQEFETQAEEGPAPG